MNYISVVLNKCIFHRRRRGLSARKVRAGFTLVELIVTLACYTVVLLSLSIFLRGMSHQANKLDDSRGSQWYLAVVQIGQYLKAERVVSATSGRLETEEFGTSRRFIYEQYGQMIRRRSEAGGHEPLLIGVSQATFSVDEQFVRLEVTLDDQQRYQMAWQAGREHAIAEQASSRSESEAQEVAE